MVMLFLFTKDFKRRETQRGNLGVLKVFLCIHFWIELSKTPLKTMAGSLIEYKKT